MGFIIEIIFHHLEYIVHRSGIGGGGLMTVRIPNPDGESEVYTIDFRETAPALANSSMFVRNPILSMRGGLAAAVPGEIRGLEEAHRRWSKLSWERLVWPSVQLARGWEVDKELARRIMVLNTSYCSSLDCFNLSPAFPRFAIQRVRLECYFFPQGNFTTRR